MLRPECLADLIGILLSHIGLEKHLQDDLAGFAAGTHFAIELSISSKQVGRRSQFTWK